MRRRVLGMVVPLAALLLRCVGDDPEGAPIAENDAATDAAVATDTAVPIDTDSGGSDAAPPVVVVGINAGGTASCATRSDGSLLCWGANIYGQVGAPVSTNKTCSKGGCQGVVTVPITNVASTCSGTASTCAVKTDGTVWCWGGNAEGQLGHTGGDADCSGTPCNAAPSQVAGISDAKQIGCSERSFCARTAAGEVHCWGLNSAGLIGLDQATTAQSATPNKVSLPEPAKDLGVAFGTAAGGAHACAVGTSGGVYCWGSNDHGMLGVPTASTPTTCPSPSVPCSHLPKQALAAPSTPLTKVARVRGAISSTCALFEDHTVSCWGTNGWLQLGYAPWDADEHPPTKVAALGSSFITALEGQYLVYAVIDATKTITVWGRSSNIGAIGNGALNGPLDCIAAGKCAAPTKLVLPSDVTSVSAGREYAMALTGTGEVWAWGSNGYGELGHAEGTEGDQTCDGSGCNPTPRRVVLP